jgi:multicomponent Na+:H+ antiporter subunit F
VGKEDIGMSAEAVLLLVSGVLGVLMLIALLRVILGRTAPDRMVAADTISTLVAAALVVIGTAFGEVIYVDVAIVYAMLAFVTTLFVSKYLEGSR